MSLHHFHLEAANMVLDRQFVRCWNKGLKGETEMLFGSREEDVVNWFNEKYLSYKHIRYCESANFENYPEVTKESLSEYKNTRRHSFRNRLEQFS
jgi:hypothetical protein